jgi:hypothetical protein
MANLANAIFEFIEAKVSAAGSDDAIYGATVHPTTYEEIKDNTRFIRVNDVQQSTLYPDGGNEESAAEVNAYLTVQCVVRPENASLAALKEARTAATDIALRISGLLFAHSNNLGAGVCDLAAITKRDDWVIPGGKKHAVSYLMLWINPAN